MKDDDRDLFPPPSEADLARVAAVLRQIGGPNVGWGAQQSLDVLLVEQRLKAERMASSRLTRATYVLGLATVVLALATIALVVATVRA